ncbi:hypothetical protein D3C87_1175880 [compost metagenome]
MRASSRRCTSSRISTRSRGCAAIASISVTTQCSMAEASLPSPTRVAASRTISASIRPMLASRQSKKRAGSSSSSDKDSHATSKPSDTSDWRQLTSADVLPHPAGPCTITQRLCRASSRRAARTSRASGRRAGRGGTSLVPAMGSKLRAEASDNGFGAGSYEDMSSIVPGSSPRQDSARWEPRIIETRQHADHRGQSGGRTAPGFPARVGGRASPTSTRTGWVVTRTRRA